MGDKFKLEDFTKEEIIKVIKTSYLFYNRERDFISECKRMRIEKLEEAWKKADDEWKVARDKFVAFQEQYLYGNKLNELPSEIIEKGAELERKNNSAWEKSEKLFKQLDEMYDR
jgi:hypothetical protein